MADYFVNKNAQPNGVHEIHREECVHLTARENLIFSETLPNV